MLVRKTGAEVGFAQDPDADRLAICDETGRVLDNDDVLALAVLRALAVVKTNGLRNTTVRLVVVGGGDSACEEATYLTKFASTVFMVHRRHELRASKIMAQRALTNEKITMKWNRALAEVLG